MNSSGRVPEDTGQWVRELLRAGDTHAFYISTAWLHKRAAVLQQQHYECQRCKAAGGYAKATTVHHRRYLRRSPELALEESNLEALCDQCHYEEHHKRQRITPERW